MSCHYEQNTRILAWMKQRTSIEDAKLLRCQTKLSFDEGTYPLCLGSTETPSSRDCLQTPRLSSALPERPVDSSFDRGCVGGDTRFSPTWSLEGSCMQPAQLQSSSCMRGRSWRNGQGQTIFAVRTNTLSDDMMETRRWLRWNWSMGTHITQR